jgi:uncharacterized glyoxalase superfamily protein PhnB
MQHSTIIPGLRYKDAPAAIDFLCRAFGFEHLTVYAEDKNPSIVHHAELELDGGMLMLGSARPGPSEDRLPWLPPAGLGGVTTCIYVVVPDADAHCARARAAGAEIVTEPHDNEGYPGRSYNARDPEENYWSLGTFDPWAG